MHVIVWIYLLATVLAEPQRGMRIVGGEATTVARYPYMCNMQYFFWSVNWHQSCGGALLTSRSVLSAAHCYHNDPEVSWRVVVGTTFASSGGTVRQVSQLVLHEQYSPVTVENDVAIVRLSAAVSFSDDVKVASIAGPNYNLADGTTVSAVGWGALRYQGGSPEQLQHVDIQVINQQLCAQRYAYLKTQPSHRHWPDVTDGMLCAGILDYGGKDACQGDSGGPLVYGDRIVVGVTSWGFECAHYYYPGVNARVSRYSDWISIMAAN